MLKQDGAVQQTAARNASAGIAGAAGSASRGVNRLWNQPPIFGANSSSAVNAAPSRAAATISHQTVEPLRPGAGMSAGAAACAAWTEVTGRIVCVFAACCCDLVRG